MRLVTILAAALLLASPAAAGIEQTLERVAADFHAKRLPDSIAAAPDSILIQPALRDAVLAQTLDGGREQRVYIRFDPGAASLTFDRAVEGARYRASGYCGEDCSYPQPIDAHTHPYENAPSVLDLTIVGRNSRPMLVAGRDQRLWLAVPTTGSSAIAIEEWREFRYAIFGNRLQCPARTPPGGWASPTNMGRNVEGVMRAAAHDMKIALYVLQPGETRFRKLEGFDHREPMFAVDQPITLEQLNAYEMALLRTLSLASTTRAETEGPWFDREAEIDPRTPWPALLTELAAPADEEDPPEVAGPLRNTANVAGNTFGYWFKPLPTTVYRRHFADLSLPALPFVSVQYSADCQDVLVLQGDQTFAPDAVAYSRGWKRARNHPGGWNEGWAEAAPAEFPRGQVVPW